MLDGYEYRTFDDAMAAIEAGVRDCLADNPDSVSEDDAAHDITINTFSICAPDVRHDLARCYLGWDPEFDRDLYDQYNIPLELSYG